MGSLLHRLLPHCQPCLLVFDNFSRCVDVFLQSFPFFHSERAGRQTKQAAMSTEKLALESSDDSEGVCNAVSCGLSVVLNSPTMKNQYNYLDRVVSNQKAWRCLPNSQASTQWHPRSFESRRFWNQRSWVGRSGVRLILCLPVCLSPLGFISASSRCCPLSIIHLPRLSDGAKSLAIEPQV